MVAHEVMYDIRQSAPRGNPLIGAERRGFPPLELVSGTPWLVELGRGYHRRQT